MSAMRSLTTLRGVLLVVGVALSAPAAAQLEPQGNGLVPEDDPGAQVEEQPAPPAKPTPPPAPTPAPVRLQEPTGPRNAMGEYGGVVPGRGLLNAKRKRPSRPFITWIGFQPREGGAERLFVETSVPVTHEQTTQGDVVSITIPGVRLERRNVGRRLDLSAFSGPIATVDVKQNAGKRGVTLNVKLKAGGKAPTIMAEQAAADGPSAGYHYLFVDFGL